MKVEFAVTFEFEMRPPETIRGVIEASNPATVASRAIRLARRTIHPRKWTSVVCVLFRGDANDVTD